MEEFESFNLEDLLDDCRYWNVWGDVDANVDAMLLIYIGRTNVTFIIERKNSIDLGTPPALKEIQHVNEQYYNFNET